MVQRGQKGDESMYATSVLNFGIQNNKQEFNIDKVANTENGVSKFDDEYRGEQCKL